MLLCSLLSYLDRQTLPVAIKAIQLDIPMTDGQFSWLNIAFLLAYAVMYAGGGKLLDALHGFLPDSTVKGILVDNPLHLLGLPQHERKIS